MSAAPLALLEVLDREGHVRQQMKVLGWPVRVGRALDNEWVLDDVHTAARHFTLAADEAGLHVEVGDTVNGLWVGPQRLPAGSRALLTTPVAVFKAGETVLRLRMAALTLQPEVPIQARPLPLRGMPVLWATVALNLVCLAWQAWLSSDPGGAAATFSNELVAGLGVLLGWCGAWGLLSKLMTRRSHFGWHVRVALLASLAWDLTRGLPGLLAFTLSQPWISSFGFVLPLGVLAWAVATHLRQVEPRHAGRRRVVACLVFIGALGAQLSLNLQSNDRWGQDLYLTHLYPPELRLAPTRDLERFMQGVAGLRDDLDEAAAEPAGDDEDEVPAPAANAAAP
jgi:hypothetical protein